MNIVQTPHSRVLSVPIYGAGADIFPGSMIMAGVTAETDLGVGIANTATSNLDAIGVLTELHDYSESGDALVTGAADWYRCNSGKKEMPARLVSLLDTAVLARVDYDLTSTMAVGTVDSTTSYRVASSENNIDSSFMYCVAGTGIGQLMFLKSTDATSLVIPSALTTAMIVGDTLVKILRLFHTLVVWTAPSATAETKLGTTAAAGTGRAMIMDRYIVRNGLHAHMEPLSHHNLQSLNSISDLRFYSLVSVSSTVFHRLS